jgi:outer membrane lipoprotein SlyB
MKRNAARITLLALGLVIASGCATHSTPTTFNRSEVGAARTVEWGTVRSLRDVTIQNDSRGVPTATGAVLGGIAGSTIGSGTRANTAGAVAGAVAGGAAGNAMARGSRAGVEITVELESGRTIAVTQDGSSQQFRVGDRVQVSSDGTTTRVTR